MRRPAARGKGSGAERETSRYYKDKSPFEPGLRGPSNAGKRAPSLLGVKTYVTPLSLGVGGFDEVVVGNGLELGVALLPQAVAQVAARTVVLGECPLRVVRLLERQQGRAEDDDLLLGLGIVLDALERRLARIGAQISEQIEGVAHAAGDVVERVDRVENERAVLAAGLHRLNDARALIVIANGLGLNRGGGHQKQKGEPHVSSMPPKSRFFKRKNRVWFMFIALEV